MFNGLDELYDYAEYVNNRTQGDFSALEFCRVLKYLRKVYLEDAVFKKERYRDFPAYCHHVFRTDNWERYCVVTKHNIEQKEKDWFCRDGDVLTRLKRIQETLETKTVVSSKAKESKEIEAKKEIDKVPPLPSFPVKVHDMEAFYEGWLQKNKRIYETHCSLFARRAQWSKVWGKTEGKKQAIRFQHYQDWLKYLDDVEYEAHTTPNKDAPWKKAIEVMKGFCVQHNLNENMMVKQLFYYLVKPDDAGCSKQLKQQGELLTKALNVAGETAPHTRD